VTRPAAASDGGELAEAGGGGGGDSAKNNRMSVFEPFPMRDTVQHFCEKHLGMEGRQRQNLFFTSQIEGLVWMIFFTTLSMLLLQDERSTVGG
jgi:hypothetical protein